MRDRVWIFAGLAAFVALLTLPFWHTLGRARAASSPPNLVLPANQKDCVAPAAVMRAEHMKMLVEWREDVVRRGDRRFVAYDGKVYEKSLTRTCLGCHNKEQFCDRCHAYSGVSGPYCWNCHNSASARAIAATPETIQPQSGASRLMQGASALLLFPAGRRQPSPSSRSIP